jgi:hypothetical protein
LSKHIYTGDLNHDKKILADLISFFGLNYNANLTQAYVEGFLPHLQNYEKLDGKTSPLTALERYIIGFDSFIWTNEGKPFQFYDIYRCCRHALILRKLHQRLPIIQKIKNSDKRIAKLKAALTYDEFEAVLFEIFTACAYAEKFGADKIEFIPETSEKTPDFLAKLAKDVVVECKRMNRSQDEASKIRNKIRERHLAFARQFVEGGRSALISVELVRSPMDIKQEEWNQAFAEVFKQEIGTVINSSLGKITSEPLSPTEYKDFEFCPSPRFYFDRYKFKDGEQWHGLTQGAQIQFAYLSDEHFQKGAASILVSSIGHEVTLKWSLADQLNEQLYRRTNFSLLFKGLKQLKGRKNTVLHFAFERDGAAGHRRDNLVKLFDKMQSSKKDDFGWLIFNELQFLVSLKGRYDLQEHAHIVSGPGRFSHEPLVTNVFTEAVFDELGDFGVGHTLKEIDALLDEEEE